MRTPSGHDKMVVERSFLELGSALRHTKDCRESPLGTYKAFCSGLPAFLVSLDIVGYAVASKLTDI